VLRFGLPGGAGEDKFEHIDWEEWFDTCDLARQAAASPADIREAELKPLRDLGLSGVDILDVVLAVAAGCLFSSA
jgi:hypothetical protein